jgi:hypothetical protein
VADGDLLKMDTTTVYRNARCSKPLTETHSETRRQQEVRRGCILGSVLKPQTQQKTTVVWDGVQKRQRLFKG